MGYQDYFFSGEQVLLIGEEKQDYTAFCQVIGRKQ